MAGRVWTIQDREPNPTAYAVFDRQLTPAELRQVHVAFRRFGSAGMLAIAGRLGAIQREAREGG